MLVLSRKPGEQVVLGSEITITVLEIRGNRVRIGINAPSEVNISRREIELRQLPLTRPLVTTRQSSQQSTLTTLKEDFPCPSVAY